VSQRVGITRAAGTNPSSSALQLDVFAPAREIAEGYAAGLIASVGRCVGAGTEVGARCGISSPRVLDALRPVERETFLPQGLREFTYDDTPLPMEPGQTITQPYS
jgi:hypothetical protein